MILYFSGTGNSQYVAKQIGKETGDCTLNLFQKLRDHDYGEITSEKPWVIVTPTYAWRIPRLVSQWILKNPLTGSNKIYFIMTCGGDIGNAEGYTGKLCTEKKMTCMGCAEIVMPENYIAMFKTPAKEEAEKIIQAAQGPIKAAITAIQKGEKIPSKQLSVKDHLTSGIVNDIFYPLFVHSKKFYVTEACISCQKCVGFCPMKNIGFTGGKPVWGHNCTHCMACICRCPAEAIEYGKHSKGLPRYVFPHDDFM
ncbi:MAG: flavodoxin [Lachnospiraceae bacterium]|jgi:flavodoxin/NAD-dependent dihydropyrimidine dehydrogenase PreA subunit|nr:flavodoxin [Lachnospiraceae bacterium]